MMLVRYHRLRNLMTMWTMPNSIENTGNTQSMPTRGKPAHSSRKPHAKLQHHNAGGDQQRVRLHAPLKLIHRVQIDDPHAASAAPAQAVSTPGQSSPIVADRVTHRQRGGEDASYVDGAGKRHARMYRTVARLCRTLSAGSHVIRFAP